MALPIILGLLAVAAGLTGTGLGIKGGVDMKNAKKKLNEAQSRDENNMARFTNLNVAACKMMDELGKNELTILSDFGLFSDLFEKIKNRPEFKDIVIGDIKIPKFDKEEIKKASIGAGVLIGGLSGAALGTAGGFAAASATTAAVMALGTASTGTAIASLSGVAATNATLAALGGGSLAAGGGGMAAGATVLGATTLGVGLLVGGVIFSLVGSSISGKADDAWQQMLDNEKTINKLCLYLTDLKTTANRYNQTLLNVKFLYRKQLAKMAGIVKEHDIDGRVDWASLNNDEKQIIENTVLLVGVLYNMCKVQFVKSSPKSDINVVNHKDIDVAKQNATEVITAFKDNKL